jgi:mRNA interferase MazF
MTARRGEVWFANLSPTQGRGQAGHRPVLILSDDRFNSSGAELVIVLPITSRPRSYPTRITLGAREGGLKAASHIIGEQLRTISVTRLTKRVGAVEEPTMVKVEQVVRRLLGLDR